MRRAAFVLAALVAAAAPSCGPRGEPDGASTRSYSGERVSDLRLATTLERHVDLRYRLAVPREYGKDPERRWPLILFLHGAGARGNDLAKVAQLGPIARAEADPDFPFVVAAPLCPAGEWWDTDALAALLDELEATLLVDTSRVYLTGMSMGGFGTWELALEHPDRFAAVAPLCGGGDMMKAYLTKGTAHGDAIARLPIRAVHGTDDPTVPFAETERMVAAVEYLGNVVDFVVVEGAGHDVWTATYSDPAFYDWLLEHRSERTVTAR
ncbi:MAG: prolyl oligopeptidase family serine peptidase [Planctomycetota bacterium]